MWYYAQGGQQLGPVDDGSFSELVAAGAVRPNTLVWREGMSEWRPYGGLHAGGADTFGDGATARCVECGNFFPPEETVDFQGQRVCGLCKNLYFQRLREGNAGLSILVYASVLKRFCAIMLDGIILVVASALFFMLFGLVVVTIDSAAGNPGDAVIAIIVLGFGTLYLAGIIFYFTWFVGKYGATPGKMALRIKIVRSDGGTLTYLRAFARMWALELSRMILYIGFLIAFFDEERRALHDHICDTRVIEVG